MTQGTGHKVSAWCILDSTRQFFSSIFTLPEALKLEQDASSYTYLNEAVSQVNAMDDASNFRALQVSGTDLSPGFVNGGIELVPLVQFSSCILPKSAMSVIGFSEDEIRQVLEVTALVLKLGNVKLTDEFQANGIPASGISDGKGWCHPAGASPTPKLVFVPLPM